MFTSSALDHVGNIPRVDLGRLIVFAHAGAGSLPDHDQLMFLFPTIPILLIGTIVLAAALRKRGLLGPADRTIPLSVTGAAVAATLSTGAAAIHFAVVPEHMAEFAPFGIAFVAVGWFQVGWAQAYLLRPTRAIAAAGVVVNVLIVATWLLSRTVGLPVGPEPWTPEQIGPLDLFATGFEVALIAVLVPVALPSRWPAFATQRMAFERAFVLATFCVVTVTLLTAFALVSVPEVQASIQP
jgi:hypothetical protein